MEPCCPGDGWTSVCQQEVVNEFLVLLCLCLWVLLNLLNQIYLSPWVFSLSQLSPWSHPDKRMGGRVRLSCLSGLNQQIHQQQGSEVHRALMGQCNPQFEKAILIIMALESRLDKLHISYKQAHLSKRLFRQLLHYGLFCLQVKPRAFWECSA